MKNEKSLEPVLYARRILTDFNINIEKEIVLLPILEDCNIRIRIKALPEGIDGECTDKGLNRLIIINECIYNQQRKRFTIAHEFGHIILKHNTKICKSEYFSLANYSNNIEYDANRFAAELLLPYLGIKKILKYSDLSIPIIEKIADIYNTSLLSTSIRLTLLSKYKISLVLHNSDKIIWSINSNNHYQNITNNRIKENSVIKQIHTNSIVYKNEIICSQEWSSDFNEDEKCLQETKYFSRRHEYLTLLKFNSTQ